MTATALDRARHPSSPVQPARPAARPTARPTDRTTPMTTSTATLTTTLDLRPADRPATRLATAAAVGLRTVRKSVRTPQQLVLGTVTGAMFLLIFRYVFGGAIDSGSLPYVDFLVPGFVVTSLLFSGGDVAVGVADDDEKGVTDRFRSLPVSRAALLTGRVTAEAGLLLLGLAVTTAIGFAVGFRIHGGVAEALAAFGLCAVFGFACMWLFALAGLVASNAQSAQGLALLVFPLSFVSSAYVPVDSMPGWIQPVAEHQPITVVTNAVRSLSLGDPSLAGVGQHSTAYWVALSLAWSAGLVAVVAPLAVRRYRRS
ncbi:MAG TPA: ABC transporter permease [Acidimicrobiales bacterium]|nr:ABC transporter permease [Acidimicrobiales bacterium]